MSNQNWVDILNQLEEADNAASPKSLLDQPCFDDVRLENLRDEDRKVHVLARNHLKALIECARALKWYADENHINHDYYVDDDGDEHPRPDLIDDYGKRAREALAKLKS